MTDIIVRGRWASHKTATRYVQAGKAMLAARFDDANELINSIGAIISTDSTLFRAFHLAVKRYGALIIRLS